jgi:3-deoxy-7-phosphoheptulonate synthase
MRLVTENARIRSIRVVSTPAQVQVELPLSEAAAATTFATRREVQDILSGRTGVCW